MADNNLGYLVGDKMQRSFDNERDAFFLLDLINAEFQSDPMSVQCFDLRLVERVKQCVTDRKRFEKAGIVPPDWKTRSL
jgi:hypothetical protein